jgi:hypothetical protein
VHAVKLKIDKLTDPQPAGARQKQRVGEQPLGRGVKGLLQPAVLVGRQVSRQRPRRARDIAREHQAPLRRVRPPPLADVGQEPAESDDPAALLADRDRPLGALRCR